MTKKDIIIDYLAKDGNTEKTVRVAIREIADKYNVTVSVGMYQKTKKEWSEHTVNSEHKQQWLESLMDGVRKATNLFQMAEAIRQCDVFVQNTGESIKEDLECVYDELLPWQCLLIDNYSLRERLSFTI